MKYPPFCDIIVVSLTGIDETEIKNVGNDIYEYLKNNLNEDKEIEEYKIFRPMPAPIDKIQNRYRWRIIVKGKISQRANKNLNDCLKEFYKKDLKSVKISIDVNPNNMM